VCKKSISLIPRVLLLEQTTATTPASEVEAIVRSPRNMVAAKIAAVDFNKMTSLGKPLN